MAQLGSGAEAYARSKQYEYRANSSMVITTDSRPHDTHEPTGEPKSLSGKFDPKCFGNQAYCSSPRNLEEMLKKSKKKKEWDPLSEPIALAPVLQAKRRRLQEESVLTSTEEGVYQLKTKETRAAYEAMLSVIQFQLDGQPFSIVSGAVDEILAVLKNDTIKNLGKKKEIEKLLNPITNQVFDQLVSIGRLITDYQDGTDGTRSVTGDDALDDDVGVAVEFEENEDEEGENDLDMVQEDREDEGDVVGTNVLGMQRGSGIDNDDMQDADEAMSLNVHQIDPQQCWKLAEEILQILVEGNDDRDVENKLLLHMHYEIFSLIKFLLRNWLKIVWCTRLARGEDQEERKKIEEEIVHLGPDLTVIVKQLHTTRPTAQERHNNLEKSNKEEARRLNDESSGEQ